MKVLILLIITLFITHSGCDTIEPVTGTVNGRLLSDVNLPVSHIEVKIGNQVQTTGPSGDFIFNDVVLPYDIAVIHQNDKHVEIYRNMTTYAPVIITDYNDFSGRTRFKIMFPNSLTNKGLNIAVFYSNGSNTNETLIDSEPVIDSIMHLSVYIGEPQSGKLYLISYRKDINGKVSSYENFAVSDPIDIIPGNQYEHVFTEKDISFNPEEVMITGQIIYPYEYDGNSYFNISFSPNRSIQYQDPLQEIGESKFSILAPQNLPVPVYFKITNNAEYGGYYTENFIINPGMSNLLTVQKGIRIFSPQSDNDEVDLNTFFNYKRNSGSGIYRISLVNTSLYSKYVIYTNEENFSLKDIESFFFSPINNNIFNWKVEYLGTTENVNTFGNTHYNNTLEFKTTSYDRYFRTRTNF